MMLCYFAIVSLCVKIEIMMLVQSHREYLAVCYFFTLDNGRHTLRPVYSKTTKHQKDLTYISALSCDLVYIRELIRMVYCNG